MDRNSFEEKAICLPVDTLVVDHELVIIVVVRKELREMKTFPDKRIAMQIPELLQCYHFAIIENVNIHLGEKHGTSPGSTTQ